MKLHCFSLTAIALFTMIPVVSAENLRIEVKGVYVPDSNARESFGVAGSALPVVLRLIVDESKGFYLPKGTPLIDGQEVGIETLVLPKEAVISASAALGDVHWDEANLMDVLPRSDLGFRPSVILMGDLKSGAVKAYVIFQNENRRALQVSYMKCDGGCELVDDAWTTDLRTGSREKVENVKVTISRSEALAQTTSSVP